VTKVRFDVCIAVHATSPPAASADFRGG
jgi:hypothetical protein